MNPVTLCYNCVTLVGTAGPTFVAHTKRTTMPLFNVLVALIVVGVLLWLVNTYIPMDRKIKNIFNIVVVIAVVLWLLKVAGLLDSLQSIRL